MTSVPSSRDRQQPDAAGDPFSRLRRSYPFRGGGFDSWFGISVAIVGAGMLGWRLAEEAVLSGAEVVVIDPDSGSVHNQGTVFCKPGERKVDSLWCRCAAFRPGHLRPIAADVRHTSVRLLGQCPVWFDCTDDASLAWPLTELANGLGCVLFRCAVDGSGQAELGRVLCSAGGLGHACQCCPHSLADLAARRHRTPCPGTDPSGPQPTLAGGGIAAAVAGQALSLAQRLVAGTAVDQILDHEVILDWSHFQLIHLRINRSQRCLTGHQRWSLVDLDVDSASGTLADVFAAAGDFDADDLGDYPLEVELYLHPLNNQATCACGLVSEAVGTDWADPPLCPACVAPMWWLRETQRERFTHDQAASWGILDRPLASLGLPGGALFVVRRGERVAARLLLR